VSEERPKHYIAAKMMRAVFNGLTVGVLGAIGLYALVAALNTMAATTILDPASVAFMFFGSGLTSAIGIELSKHLEGR